MDLFSAALVAECTDEEIDKFEKDPVFKRRLLIENALEEKRLLEKHNYAMEEAAIRGKANPIQWKLEKLNPRRWSSKETGKSQKEIDDLTINLIGTFPDGKKC